MADNDDVKMRRLELGDATTRLRAQLNAAPEEVGAIAFGRCESVVARLLKDPNNSLDLLRTELFAAFVEAELMRELYGAAFVVAEVLDPDCPLEEPESTARLQDALTALVIAVGDIRDAVGAPSQESETLQ